MNVLVYSGPGVSQTSLTHTVNSLRNLLVPHYTVQTITPDALFKQPWTSNCAMLVVPGGRDVPYVSALSDAVPTIRSFVGNGGVFLGICAGAYFASKDIEWEKGTPMEVSGPRPLRFFNGTSRGCTYKGFHYDSEDGARAVNIRMADGAEVEAIYYNGGGEFVDAHDVPGVTVIATYTEEDGSGKAAGVLCQVQAGKAVLWAVHPEYPLTLEPTSSAIARTRPDLNSSQIADLEVQRQSLLQDTLRLLGLHLPAQTAEKLKPLPQFTVSTHPRASKAVTDRLSEHWVAGSIGVLKDTNDTFHFHDSIEAEDVLFAARSDSTVQPVDSPKHVIVYQDASLPPRQHTPLFDLAGYFAELGNRSGSDNAQNKSSNQWRMGELLLYGEIVTSTQTMLDKNAKLLSSLPTPLLSLASYQLSGRGRGANAWLSPTGCLQFSLHLRLALSSFPASKLVFVQYLFGIAVVEACRDEKVLGSLGESVRLKWPNDIYTVVGRGEGPKKIGGILVNTSFTGGTVDLVIGCGLNVLTAPPIMSLAQLVPPSVTGVEVSMERTAAVIMATFERMWATFIASRGSFAGFMDLYLERWLHSDQSVTITTVDPPISARIVAITEDHGLLRAVPSSHNTWSHRGEQFIDLQPDGNSFDLMAGLIRTKK